MKKGESSEYWEAVLKKLTLSQPGKWMTEGIDKIIGEGGDGWKQIEVNDFTAPEDDIGSVAKLLGVLCSSVEKVKALQLFDIFIQRAHVLFHPSHPSPLRIYFDVGT